MLREFVLGMIDTVPCFASWLAECMLLVDIAGDIDIKSRDYETLKQEMDATLADLGEL